MARVSYSMPTPELELSADLERLAAVGRLEPNAVLAHPPERREAVCDQGLHEVRVGSVLGHPRHVGKELFLGIGAEVGFVLLSRRQIGHQLQEVGDPPEGHSHRASGEG